MIRSYPFDDQFQIDHPYDDVADQLDASCVSKYQQYNRKRQRRQAAAVVVESLWNNNSNSGGNSTNPASTYMNRIGTATTTSAGRKSTAQPRPVLNVPPRGIGPITVPNENDVLCGRGGRINSHAGNVQFRDIIHSKKSEYLAPSTKKLEKAHIAAGIVSDIRTMDPAGRFLKEDKGTSMWFDIGDAKAIKKTGQALREDAPDIRPAIDGGTVSSGDEKKKGGSTTKKTPGKTKSKSLSPPRSTKAQTRRGNTMTGPPQNNNLRPVWPQQGNNMQQTTDPRAQMSMPPPFLPQSNSNIDVNINNLNNYSMQQPMHQQGFETCNIPMQVPPQGNIPSSSFPNQIYSGAQSVTNKAASASRKVMEALLQTGPTAHYQQHNPYGYGRQGVGVGISRREPNVDDVAFGRAFYDPEGQHIMNPGGGGDDHTVSTISGLSEPNSSTMMGSGVGNSSNLMNSSLKSNFSVGNSLRLSNLMKGSSTNNKQTYDPMAMSGLGLSGSIKSGFGGSLTRSNSFPDTNSVVEGDNWKSIMDADDNLLDEAALKYSGGSNNRIGARNSSGMSIGSLMDVQSNASSTQWLAAAGLNYSTTMPDDKSFMDKSFMSSAMMSTDLDALDLASSERLHF